MLNFIGNLQGRAIVFVNVRFVTNQLPFMGIFVELKLSLSVSFP